MEIDVSSPSSLPLLYSNVTPEPIDSGLVAFCDVHDLLAVVTARSQNVVVFRINGQQAFSINRKDSDCRVSVLKWKPDGSFLGVGWSDGSVGVYSGEDGKLMSLSSTRGRGRSDGWRLDLLPEMDEAGDEGGECEAACLGWTTYAASSGKGVLRAGDFTHDLTADDWYDGNGATSGDEKPTLSRLTKAIATLDATAVLPRLSALPIHALRFGPSEQKFTTQAGLDTLLDSDRTASESVTTLITSGTSGTSNLFLDDTVGLGSFSIGDSISQTVHASHPQCASQVILSRTKDVQSLNLHYIDLPLRDFSGPLLHVVTTNTKRIQSLISYITQTIRCMQSDLTSNISLPSRIIGNIGEELTSNGEDDLVTSLYQLAMTGNFTPTMLEWLTETIRENQQKRWDKSVNDMYNHIQTHIFVHLIPALDRLAIAVNAIRGHAKMHQGTTNFVPPEPFTTLMDDLDSIRLVAQRLQLLVMTEHRRFRAFSKWLKVMVDIGVAGPNSKGAVETEERETPNLDYNLILMYLSETLMQSGCASYLEQKPGMKGSCSEAEFWQSPEIVNAQRDTIVRAMRGVDAVDGSGKQEAQRDVLNLPTLAVRLAGSARRAVESIRKWQSGMLPTPAKVSLPIADHGLLDNILDVQLQPLKSTDGSDTENVTRILFKPDGSQLALLTVTRLQSKKCTFQEDQYNLHIAGELLHAQMVKQDRCLILWREEGSKGRVLLLTCDLSQYNEQDSSWTRVVHAFEGKDGFEPIHFVVGGRLGRRVCVVFSERSQAWRVFNLEKGALR